MHFWYIESVILLDSISTRIKVVTENKTGPMKYWKLNFNFKYCIKAFFNIPLIIANLRSCGLTHSILLINKWRYFFLCNCITCKSARQPCGTFILSSCINSSALRPVIGVFCYAWAINLQIISKGHHQDFLIAFNVQLIAFSRTLSISTHSLLDLTPNHNSK